MRIPLSRYYRNDGDGDISCLIGYIIMGRYQDLSLIFVLALAGLAISGWVQIAGAQSTSPSMAVVEGRVTDPSGDPIPGATVQVPETERGVAADPSGRFRLTVTTGGVELRIQAVGYRPETKTVRASGGETVRLDVRLDIETVALGQITVEADRRRPGTVHRLSAQSIKNAPALGEPDAVRAAAFLPGVAQTNDLTATLNVRGGAADQNQFLLDGVEVYNPRHLVGVFGAFNLQAIQSVNVYTASYPVAYGKRLSGIVDLSTRVPRDTATTLANVSLVSASLVRSQRIGRTSVLVAARQTYLDPVLRAVGSEFRYQFFDGNVKITHPLGAGFTIEGMGFLSRDGLVTLSGGEKEENSDWGGWLGALRLRHEYGRLTQSLTASWVRSHTGVQNRFGTPRVDNALDDRTVDYRLRVPLHGILWDAGISAQLYDLDYDWSSTLSGDRTIEDIFYPGVPLVVDTTASRTLAVGYVGGGREVGPFWVDAGLRTTRWIGTGGWHVAPRVCLSTQLTASVEVFASTGRYLQFVATGTEGEEDSAGAPLFLLDAPMTAWTTTVGTSVQLGSAYRLWAEGYGRTFSDLARIEDRTGGAASGPQRSIPLVEKSGRSAGIDLRIEKTEGWLTGQLSYSFLWSRIDENGEDLPSDWSTPHTVQGMLGFHLGQAWLVTVAGTVRSGLPYTPVRGRYYAVDAQNLRQYETTFIDGPANSARFPAYRRFDVSVRRMYRTDWGAWTLYVQALNVFNTRNSLRVDWRQYYRFGYADSKEVTSSLPVVPSVGVELQF